MVEDYPRTLIDPGVGEGGTSRNGIYYVAEGGSLLSALKQPTQIQHNIEIQLYHDTTHYWGYISIIIQHTFIMIPLYTSL